MGSPRATELEARLRTLTAADKVDHEQVKQVLAQLKVRPQLCFYCRPSTHDPARPQIELSELGLLVPDSSSLDPGALATARESLQHHT